MFYSPPDMGESAGGFGGVAAGDQAEMIGGEGGGGVATDSAQYGDELVAALRAIRSLFD